MIGCPPLFSIHICFIRCVFFHPQFTRLRLSHLKITLRARHEVSYHTMICLEFVSLFFYFVSSQTSNKPNEAYNEIGYRIEFVYERIHRTTTTKKMFKCLTFNRAHMHTNTYELAPPSHSGRWRTAKYTVRQRYTLMICDDTILMIMYFSG